MVSKTYIENMISESQDALVNPKPGDWWSEMGCAYFLILRDLGDDRYLIFIPNWDVENRYAIVTKEMIKNTVSYAGGLDNDLIANVYRGHSIYEYKDITEKDAVVLNPDRWALIYESFYYIPNRDTFVNWMMSAHQYLSRRNKDLSSVVFPVLIIPVISDGVVTDYKIEQQPENVLTAELLTRIRAKVYTIHPKGSNYVSIY